MYTLNQVSQHNKPDDLWIVLHNKVYNITKYLQDHPGGDEILLQVAGSDATEAFEDVGHSDEAREQLSPFYIGDLPEQEQSKPVEVYRPTFEHVSQAAAVTVKPSHSRSLLKSSIKLGLTGLAGGFIYCNRNIPLYLSLPNIHGSTFWSGIAIATTTQLSLTMGLAIWISTKLDVQQEFTHHVAHRPSNTSRLLHLKKTIKADILDPKKWTPFPLSAKEILSPNVYKFTFALPHPKDTLNLPIGQHLALKAHINGKDVIRSYTPISNYTDPGRIELLVKIYPDGQMTQYLASMAIGQQIDIRGPKGAMKYSSQYAKTIGMIAGGTGITPMYQLIRAIYEDEADDTRVVLLYANTTEKDILLRDELDKFVERSEGRLKVHYVLSHPGQGWEGYSGFVDGEMVGRELKSGEREGRKMLLCGPPGMVKVMKNLLEGEDVFVF